MARDADFYLNRALKAFDAGFVAKARQIEALKDVNSVFHRYRDQIMAAALESRVKIEDPYPHYQMAPKFEAIYWNMPDYPHQWNSKHAKMVRDAFGARFDDLLARIEDLVSLRAAIKAAPLNPPPPKAENPYEVKVRAKLADMFAKRKADYLHAVELGEIFGGLPVYVNSHIVHGHKGAVFYRNFYYLQGKFVALNVIMAAAQELERRREAAEKN